MKFLLSSTILTSLFLSSSAFSQVKAPDFKPVEITKTGPVVLGDGDKQQIVPDRSGGKGFNSIKIPGIGEFDKDGNDISTANPNSNQSEKFSQLTPSVSSELSSGKILVDEVELKGLLSDPKKLLALALVSLENGSVGNDVAMQNAISRYFLIRLSDYKKGVWLGDTSKPGIAYAFVDWSSPYAGVFVKAVEEYSEKAGVKTALIPAWVSLEQRDAALAVSAITQKDAFVDFYNKVTSNPSAYKGNPQDIIPVDLKSASVDIDVVDPVESAHLMLSALKAPQPMILMSNGSVYVGDISNSDEMVEFFKKPEHPTTRTSGPSIGFQMPLPDGYQGQ